ncbi:MAG: SMP-30/gluconolactonase/LRE family protein [Acidobacteriota bacterium]|nr:SMP-30/gluconolactonase/LRE family protein [Acidobacteriota bacterium]
MSNRELRVILDGLTFPEGPRWHDGRLFFSDFYSHRVLAVDLDGNPETICEVPNQPSGLGWLPDGRLLVVSMRDRRLLRLDPDGLTEAADLSDLAPSHCNDMVVDADGRAYVGNFGFDRHIGEGPRSTNMVRVDPDGATSVAAEDLQFPNGTVITPDGATLIVGETGGGRLTAYDRDSDGNLSNRRVWADLGGHVPDGICLDVEGAIWSADPRNNVVIRVHEGGEIVDRVSTDTQGAFACMLGGADRRTLCVCTAKTSGPEAMTSTTGRVEVTDVEVPGAGWP